MIFIGGFACLALGFWLGRRTRDVAPERPDPAQSVRTPLSADQRVALRRLGIPTTLIAADKCGQPVRTNLGYVACLKSAQHLEPCQ